jgi:hypothetical protein
LLRTLDSILINLTTPRAERVAALAKHVLELWQIIQRLIISRTQNVQSFLDKYARCTLDYRDTVQMVQQLIIRIPGITKVRAYEAIHGSWWVRHDINTGIFRGIKPELLVVVLPTEVALTVDLALPVVTLAARTIAERSVLSNSVLLLADGQFGPGVREVCCDSFGPEILGAMAQVGELVSVHDANDRRSAFEDLLVARLFSSVGIR